MRRRTLFLAIVVVLVAVGAAAGATGTPQVVARISTGSMPCSEAAGFGALWVDNYGSGTLARVDPAHNDVTEKIRVGAGPCGVAIGAGSV